VSYIQQSINIETTVAIKLVKKAISNDRGLISTLVAYNGKNESTMLEFAYAAGYHAFHEEMDDMTPDEVEAEADEEGIDIEITVSGGDADVTVNDDTDDDGDDE
jgi:hypothetical protein